MKKTLLFIAFTCMVYISKAQFAVGGNVGFNYFLAPGVGVFPSFSPFAEYGFQEGKLIIRGSLNLYLPKNYKSISSAYALNNSISPLEISVPTTQKLNITSVCIDAKRYIGEDATLSDGGMYAGLGVCMFIGGISTLYGTYDSQNYILSSPEKAVSYKQWMSRGVFGYDKAFKFGTLFIEAQLTVELTRPNVTSYYSTINIPSSIGALIGYKYVFKQD